MFSVTGNQLSCPDHWTIPLGFELWPLLLQACLVFNREWTHCVRPNILLCHLWPSRWPSGCSGKEWCLVWCFFLRSSSPMCQPLGATVWELLTSRMEAEQSLLVAVKMSGCCLNLAIPPFLLLGNLKWWCCCSWILSCLLGAFDVNVWWKLCHCICEDQCTVVLHGKTTGPATSAVEKWSQKHTFLFAQILSKYLSLLICWVTSDWWDEKVSPLIKLYENSLSSRFLYWEILHAIFRLGFDISLLWKARRNAHLSPSLPILFYRQGGIIFKALYIVSLYWFCAVHWSLLF